MEVSNLKSASRQEIKHLRDERFAVLIRQTVWLFALVKSRFDAARRKPERSPRIDPIRIELQHLVVESSRGCRCRGYAVEIADVLPGLFNDLGAVVVPRSLVSGDHSAWVE